MNTIYTTVKRDNENDGMWAVNVRIVDDAGNTTNRRWDMIETRFDAEDMAADMQESGLLELDVIGDIARREDESKSFCRRFFLGRSAA